MAALIIVPGTQQVLNKCLLADWCFLELFNLLLGQYIYAVKLHYCDWRQYYF